MRLYDLNMKNLARNRAQVHMHLLIVSTRPSADSWVYVDGAKATIWENSLERATPGGAFSGCKTNTHPLAAFLSLKKGTPSHAPEMAWFRLSLFISGLSFTFLRHPSERRTLPEGKEDRGMLVSSSFDRSGLEKRSWNQWRMGK